MRKYITYQRVSSTEQGKSGLGLEAQARDIQLFLDNYAESPYEVVGDFVETHTGSDNDRPQLNAAIALAKKTGAVLAEQERAFISQRTTAALQAAKARGVRLGAPVHHIDAFAKAKKQRALEDAQKVEGVIVPLRQSGASLRTICGVLNASGARTCKGGVSYHPLVSQMLKRLEAAT